MNKVHGVPLSPFVRKVLLTLEYKGIDYENIPMVPGSQNPDFLAISPLGKIPVFQDDYITLPDSSVICQYLEQKYPQSSIYPSNPVSKAKALWLEEYADSKLIELLGGGLFFELLVAPKIMGRPTDEQKVKATKKALPKFLDYLETQVRPNGFLVDSQLSIADLSLPSMFINAEYAGYQVDKHFWPKLAGYLAFMKEQPLLKNRLQKEKPILDSITS